MNLFERIEQEMGEQAVFARERKFSLWEARKTNWCLTRCQKKIGDMKIDLSKLARHTPKSHEHLKRLREDLSVLFEKIERYKVD